MLLTSKKGLAAFLADRGSSEKALPSIAGTYAGRGLVICGDAACVWDDLEAFGCRSDLRRGSVVKSGFDFMAVNRLGETFPGHLEHWYSNAAHLLTIFKGARRQEYAEFAVKHTHSCQSGAMWLWPWSGSGTSSLGAALTGVALGYAPVVLCGIPLDDGPHNGEPHWRKTKFSTEAPDGKKGAPELNWQKAKVAFEDKVRSMSGRTKDWLGAP